MLFNLAFKNIKKSIKDYSIYFFTLVVAVCIFYTFNSIDAQESMLIMNNSKTDIIEILVELMGYVSVFVSFILGFLIIYSNNFLIKRRKKEFGLYLTLGMSKTKVSSILVIETLIVGLISLGVGLLLGVVLSQFLSIFTAKLFEVNMTSFKFIFSSSALIKTMIYFGIIFALVMVFNVISINKNRLITLLTAKSKNENVKIRNKFTVIVSFILSAGLLYYAYRLLFNGAMFSFGKDVVVMLICGALGTYFLFFCLSGIFLKIAELNKKFYYKNLNMFTLKQISSKANTSVFSTTIICLMLLLTIGILSGAISLVSIFNNDINNSNPTDFTLNKNAIVTVVQEDGSFKNEDNKYSVKDIIKQDFFKDYVKEYTTFNTYHEDDVVMSSLISKSMQDQLLKDYGSDVSFDAPLDIMSESDYNNYLTLLGKSDEKVDVKQNEYLLTVDIDKAEEFYKDEYIRGKKITINKIEVTPAGNKIEYRTFRNSSSSSNFGTIIIDDSIITGMTSYTSTIIGNYVDTNRNLEDFEREFFDKCSHFGSIDYTTKLDMQNNGVSLKAILTFVGLYLGIIFSIASATVLAIKELSESSDNKERFLVLKQIGADPKMTNKALFSQIAVAFILPLAVALFHAFFGLRELNGMIELLGHMDLTKSIFLTSLFIVIVYGGYFVATYLASRNIIKE